MNRKCVITLQNEFRRSKTRVVCWKYVLEVRVSDGDWIWRKNDGEWLLFDENTVWGLKTRDIGWERVLAPKKCWKWMLCVVALENLTKTRCSSWEWFGMTSA